MEYWNRQKRRILEKNTYGIASNDAGPLWLGLRLVSPKTRQAYQGVTYSKGAYLLLMLKSMMYDDQHTGANPNHKYINLSRVFVIRNQTTHPPTTPFNTIP